jgi:hypothetical protein
MKTNIREVESLLYEIISYNLTLAESGARAEEYLVPYLEGEPGIGKTTGHHAAIVRIAAKLGIDLKPFAFCPASYDPGEFGGIFAKQDDGNFRKCWPEWLPHGAASVLMDEADKCRPAQSNMLAQAICEHRVGQHTVPRNVFFTLAGNALHHRAGGNALPTQVWNRVVLYEIVTDARAIIEHGMEIGSNPHVLSYLKTNPEHAQDFRPERRVNPTGRQWLGKISGALDKSNLTGNLLRATVIGSVGDEAGEGFLAHLKLLEAVGDPMGVFDDPEGYPIPDNRALVYAICAEVARLVKKQPGKLAAFDTFLQRVDNVAREVSMFAFQYAFRSSPLDFNNESGQRMTTRYHVDY